MVMMASGFRFLVSRLGAYSFDGLKVWQRVHVQTNYHPQRFGVKRSALGILPALESGLGFRLGSAGQGRVE